MKYIKGIFAIVLIIAFFLAVGVSIIYNIKELLTGALLIGGCYLLLGLIIGYGISKSDTFWGKFKDAISYVFLQIANWFAEASYEIGTPAAEKRRIKAESLHASMLKTMNDLPTRYTPEIFFDKYEGHRKQLKVLDITREQWLSEAYPIWYKAFLYRAYHGKKCPALFDSCEYFDKNEKLKETLLYFGITREEWDNNDPKILNIINNGTH